jgi:hypothetical protein
VITICTTYFDIKRTQHLQTERVHVAYDYQNIQQLFPMNSINQLVFIIKAMCLQCGNNYIFLKYEYYLEEIGA